MWMEFLKAIKNGDFKVNPMTWFSIAGAVIYTIVPIDLIPDPLIAVFGLGAIDDLGLWGIVGVFVAREYNRFKAVAEVRSEVIDVESVEVN